LRSSPSRAPGQPHPGMPRSTICSPTVYEASTSWTMDDIDNAIQSEHLVCERSNPFSSWRPNRCSTTSDMEDRHQLEWMDRPKRHGASSQDTACGNEQLEIGIGGRSSLSSVARGEACRAWRRNKGSSPKKDAGVIHKSSALLVRPRGQAPLCLTILYFLLS